jgi:hypothetical protein|nr:MAG TPA: hypothetical protein [Bacteriophage sp.]
MIAEESLREVIIHDIYIYIYIVDLILLDMARNSLAQVIYIIL